MKNSITINGKELEITHATAISSGHGHKEIIVSFIECEKVKGITLKATTNNMPAYDKANDLEGPEKYMAFYKIIASQIQDQLEEFISPLI